MGRGKGLAELARPRRCPSSSSPRRLLSHPPEGTATTSTLTAAQTEDA